MPAQRLSMANASALLNYDRAQVTPGIVHLGVGAFHRAHVASYIDSILPLDPSWGIIGASLRRPDTRQALVAQDFLYTLAIRSAAGTENRIIGSLLDVLDAHVQRNQLLATMTDPRIRIVSLTVTEKGYCHDPSTGNLDPSHPDIVHDLSNPAGPVSAPGLIVRALELRENAGIAPFTVMSCDNLPANGQTTARIIAGFAALRSAELENHIRANVAFPSTMIDRIVPATTDEDRALVTSTTGLRDEWPVVTEPFTQWVVEDVFTMGRPPLESAGVELVSDVARYELMKLRMLNGSHSTLAYLGYLAGHEFVSQVIANPVFHALAHRLMTEEVIPTLEMDNDRLAAYRDALLARFSNPALKHRTWQIAMDGSQKLPQRLLGTIKDRLAKGLDADCATLGVAAWMRYVAGSDERGHAIDVRDPLASRLKEIGDVAGQNPTRLVEGMLMVKEVFGDHLPNSASFKSCLVQHATSLYELGAAETVRKMLANLHPMT